MTRNVDSDNEIEEICSVSAMARKLRLSRARFYQLLQGGVFPPPAYDICTKRPFYPYNLQQQCQNIRRRGITAKGQPVFFYAPRKNGSKVSRSKDNQLNQVLVDALKKMGLRVTQRQLKQAIKAIYPEGLPNTEDLGPVLSRLFQHLR